MRLEFWPDASLAVLDGLIISLNWFVQMLWDIYMPLQFLIAMLPDTVNFYVETLNFSVGVSLSAE